MVTSVSSYIEGQMRGRGAYQPVAASVPFDDRVGVRTIPFSFGIPFPWVRHDEGSAHGDEPAVSVRAPRADDIQCSFRLWITPDELNVAAADLKLLVKSLKQHGRSLGERKVNLAGARARIVVIHSPGKLVLEHLLVNAGNDLLTGQFVAHGPSGLREETVLPYLAHFDTMLATWAWEP